MANEDGSIRVVYNGEIYNFVELRPRLEARGHQFRSHADTEVIVHLYEERGLAFVDELDGHVRDSAVRRTRAAVGARRHRAGKRPFFY